MTKKLKAAVEYVEKHATALNGNEVAELLHSIANSFDMAKEITESKCPDMESARVLIREAAKAAERVWPL